jgi:putative membrane protein
MRYVYLVLIIVVATVVFAFSLQNLEKVTLQLFSATITMPVSVLVPLVYVLGMLTGGFVIGLVRTWYRGAKPMPGGATAGRVR